METTLAILMVLGIYIGVPVMIGLAIAGVLGIRGEVRLYRARQAMVEHVAEVHGRAVKGQPTKEHVTVA